MNRTQIVRQPKVFIPAPEKKQKNYKVLFKIFCLGLFLVAVIYFLFYSGVFTIKTILVDENLPSDLASSTEMLKGKNILSLRTGDIRTQLLAEFPDLNDIKIVRGLPSTLRIIYIARDPKMVWRSNGKDFLIDESGFYFKDATSGLNLPTVVDTNDLPVKLGEQVVSPNFVTFVTDLNSQFSRTQLTLDHFEVAETTFQVDAVTMQNIYLKFDTTRTVDSQLVDFEKFWQAHANEAKVYVDLRVEGKIFYK